MSCPATRAKNKARKELEAKAEYERREKAFMASGGVKKCGTCELCWRCPTDSEAQMPCWCLNRWWNG